ncbi:MAG: type-F conjugative transfer system secretin TraK [Acidithiobacillus sp.]|nr:type-F conjugative transfer system secretin TraK [Acidithiobacillus sp.]
MNTTSRYWILCALSLLPASAMAGVVPPPPQDSNPIAQGALMGARTSAEYNQVANGSGAFAQGADNGSGRFVFPSSPNKTSGSPSPAFASLGHIPDAPKQPDIKGGRMPAPMPPLAPGSAPYTPPSQVTPPPLPASRSTVQQAASNDDGAMSDAPPHMSFKAATIGSVPVSTTDIRIQTGETYAVHVSGVTPNLFTTPFAHPKIMTDSDDYVKSFTHGSNIIVSVTPSFPEGVYITGRNPNDPVASITLIPKKIPARNYKLTFPGFVPAKAPRIADHSAYASVMVSLMRDAVLNRAPENYRQSRRIPDLMTPVPISWTGLDHWIGGRYQIESYRLTNNLHQKIDLVENEFYRKGILSVAFYPHHKLYPGESTRLYLVAKLPASHRGLGAVW